MKLYITINTVALLVFGTTAVSLHARAAPRFDIYLHGLADCADDDFGEICRGITADECCYFAKTPPALPLFSSADYTDAGSGTKSSVYEIKLYTARGTGTDPNFDPCGLQIAKDDQCASDGGHEASTGAMVNDGSGTLRRRADGPPRIVNPTHYFYRAGIKQWTLEIDSKAGIAFKDVPKGRREAYLMEHGDLKIFT